MSVVIAAAVFVGLCVIVEIVARRSRALSPELVRKLAHMSSATVAAALPLVLSFGEIALLGVVFAGVMAVSQRVGVFSSIHDVSRSTYGEICFPLGIAALALLCPEPAPFAFGVLVLGLGDGLAALVGSRYGRRRLPFAGTRKTFWGTGTFLGVSFVLGVTVLAVGGVGPGHIVLAAATIAAVLTPVELFLTYGLDNLALPGIAGLLLAAL